MPGSEQQSYTLQSAGLGFSQTWTQLRLLGAVGWPIDNEIPDQLLDEDASGMRGWLQLVYSY